jgi:hypothetical protein
MQVKFKGSHVAPFFYASEAAARVATGFCKDSSSCARTWVPTVCRTIQSEAMVIPADAMTSESRNLVLRLI